MSAATSRKPSRKAAPPVPVCPSKIGPPCPTRFSAILKDMARSLTRAIERLTEHRADIATILSAGEYLYASERIGNRLDDLAKAEETVKIGVYLIRTVTDLRDRGIDGSTILERLRDVAIEALMNAATSGVRCSSCPIDTALSVYRTKAQGEAYGNVIWMVRMVRLDTEDNGFLDDSARLPVEIQDRCTALLAVARGEASLLKS